MRRNIVQGRAERGLMMIALIYLFGLALLAGIFYLLGV